MGTLSADLGFKYPPFREGAISSRSIRSSSAARPIEISVAVDACRTRSVSPVHAFAQAAPRGGVKTDLLDNSCSKGILGSRLSSGRARMTDGTTIAANLARLRLDRSLTQEDLALKSGLSRLALGRIERGDAIPRASTVRALAKALNVPVGELIVPVRPLESVRFRAKAKVRSREQILAVVSKWLEAYAWLEEELGERAAFGFRKARQWSDQAEPAAVARAARNAVDLAPDVPLRDICELLNHGGVKLLLLDTNRDSFFGLSVGQADDGPAVVVNTWERISVERWIFTAAHELGHLLLHPHEYQREATALPEMPNARLTSSPASS